MGRLELLNLSARKNKPRPQFPQFWLDTLLDVWAVHLQCRRRTGEFNGSKFWSAATHLRRPSRIDVAAYGADADYDGPSRRGHTPASLVNAAVAVARGRR
jgi:hypothetical protein